MFRQGDPSNAVFYIQSGKVKKTVLSEQGKEAVVAVLGAGVFLGEGCLARRAAASIDGFRSDEMCDRANIEDRNYARDPRRAGVCRVIYLAPPGPQRSYRRGPSRSTVQFEREASRARLLCFWRILARRVEPEPVHSKSQPGDARRNDRNGLGSA